MAYTIIRGKAVSGADTYKLYKKQGSSYAKVAESSRLHFDLLALGVSDGDYAVKAFGTGYKESDYSNLVSYTKPATEEIPDTPIVPDTPVTPDPDIPETPDPETPETPDPDVPETPTVGECVITFEMQGHGDQPAEITIETPGTIPALSVPVAEGYTFGGWWLDSTYSEQVTEGTKVEVGTTSLTLYAKWTENTPASGDEDDTETGGGSTLPTPEIYTVRSQLTNCHFEGEEPSATVEAQSQLIAIFMLDDNCVWYPQYVKVLMGGTNATSGFGLTGEDTANPYYVINIPYVTGNVEIYAFAVPKVEIPENFAGTWVFNEELSEDFIPWANRQYDGSLYSGSLTLDSPFESMGKEISLLLRLRFNGEDTLDYSVDGEVESVYDFTNKKWLIEEARTFTISEASVEALSDVQKMLIAGNATKQA